MRWSDEIACRLPPTRSMAYPRSDPDSSQTLSFPIPVLAGSGLAGAEKLIAESGRSLAWLLGGRVAVDPDYSSRSAKNPIQR